MKDSTRKIATKDHEVSLGVYLIGLVYLVVEIVLAVLSSFGYIAIFAFAYFSDIIFDPIHHPVHNPDGARPPVEYMLKVIFLGAFLLFLVLISKLTTGNLGGLLMALFLIRSIALESHD